MNLNKPGSGLKLMNQVKLHPGVSNKNSTRSKQLEVHRTQQKNQQTNKK